MSEITPFYINWWLENVKESQYKYMVLSDIVKWNENTFGSHKVLNRLFNITPKIIRCDTRPAYCLVGIEAIDKETKPKIPLNSENLKELIPDNMAMFKDEESITIILPTKYILDRKRVVVEARIADNKWELIVDGIHVKMEKHGIDPKFENTTQDIEHIIKIMSCLTPCRGSLKDFIDNGWVTQQVLNDGETETKILRSKYCRGMTSWTGKATRCENCSRHPSMPSATPAEDTSEDSLVSLQACEQLYAMLEKVFPMASGAMRILLEAHQNNQKREKNGNRWSKEAIDTCLNILSKSPATYKQLQESDILLLPSQRMLYRYRKPVTSGQALSSRAKRTNARQRRASPYTLCESSNQQ